MKYLGVDYGSKRVGIAVSDEGGKIAFPRAEVPNDSTLLPFVAGMAEQERVAKIIVGDTRALNREQNTVTPEAEAFVAELARLSALPVEFAREAWSSVEASRYAPKGEEHNNAAAAAVILQRFIDMRGDGVE